MVIGRIKVSSLVKVGGGFIPSDLKGSDFSSLVGCFCGSYDSGFRTFFDLGQQSVGLREISRCHRRANLRKPVVADIATKTGKRRLQFSDFAQRVNMGRLDIGKLAVNLL